MRLLILSQRLVLLLGGTVGDGVVVIVVDSSSPSSSCCSFLSNNDSDLDLLSRNDAERADAASSVPDIVCERDSIDCTYLVDVVELLIMLRFHGDGNSLSLLVRMMATSSIWNF